MVDNGEVYKFLKIFRPFRRINQPKLQIEASSLFRLRIKMNTRLNLISPTFVIGLVPNQPGIPKRLLIIFSLIFTDPG